MPFKNPHPLYNVWRSMRDRCLNPRNKQWKDYGGRGITICERWAAFSSFVEDMGPRPNGYSIDRIDNGEGYSPENCRWADRRTQQRNQRRAVFVEVEGVKYRAIELAEKAGIKTDAVVSRAARGLSLDQILSPEPIRDLSGLNKGAAVSAAKRRSKTHCRNGHEMTPANVLLTKEGYRSCRKCHCDRQKERWHRISKQIHCSDCLPNTAKD